MELLDLPLVLSGDSPGALAAAAGQLREDVESTPDEALRNLIHHRLTKAHAYRRSAVFASDRAELLRGLNALARGQTVRKVLSGLADVARKPVLVFPGQGLQWPGMAAEILASSPDYRARFNGSAQALRSQLGWDPGAALVGGEDLTRLGTIQPVQFAVGCALVDSWRDFGLRETAVVGHSVGEVAAAHASGALSDEDAARLVALFCTAFTSIEGQGAMASVAAPVERVGPLLGKWTGRLHIAALNSARNVTISGDPDAVEELLAQLTAAGIWAWKVPGLDVAGHSPQVEALRELVLEQAPRTASGSPRVALYSAVTGSRLDTADLTPRYWFRVMREAVLFEKAVRTLVDDGHRLFIEVSAHPVLTLDINETLRFAGMTGVAIPTLDRRKGDKESFLHALTHAFVNGAPIDWNIVRERLVSRPQVDVTHNHPEEQLTESVAFPEDSDSENSDRPAFTRPRTAPELIERQTLIEDRTLHQVSPSEQREVLVGLIARETAAVLGHTFSVGTRTFLEIGFTSLTAVELVTALSAATGLDLPATLVFDHPTPLALAAYLRRALGLAPPAGEPALPVTDRGPAAEPIAIVGIGCRYPGGVASAQSLWELVLAGRDAVDEHPTDRGWDANGLYDPTPGLLGKVYTREGGFLYDAAGFDAGFFGLSPREATSMEPQQRLLLEVSWEALEHAGIDPDSLRGSSTGVFAGVMPQEYGPRLQQAPDDVAGYAYLGTAACVASGRIAYALGLEGPAITMDTACSSSLVAIHVACEALRSNDCELALAGGATVMSTPGVLVDFSRQQALAPDGRCKAFSASADGVGLAEGVGMVVLERLSAARAGGHPILAVIRGSAVNQDGASNGLTAPSGSAQQHVIRRALANAGLSPQEVDAIEAHGTGTPLGDPIEAHALLATYGQRAPAGRPAWLGSIKSNLGHTQAAAGVAGLIKMVMALRHGLLPQSLHIDAPSPHVDWSTGAIQLLTRQQQWPDIDGRPRRAAVSSFGVSGTNGHLIVEQAPPPSAPAAGSTPDAGTADGTGTPSTGTASTGTASMVLWPVSAKTETALRAQAARLRQHVISRPGLDPVDVGYSLGTTRSRFPRRGVVWGRSRDQLLEGLHALAEHRAHPGLAQGEVPPAGPGKLVFVFPGQGSQWSGMGMGLYDAFPVYRQALDQADEALRRFTQWSVVDVLRKRPHAPALKRIEVAQPALFAVLISLARLWESFGLVPDAVVGHSQGEIAAAQVAGALTLHDAAKLVVLRARALSALSGTGAMATVSLSADRTRSLLDHYDGRISIAAVNSPVSTVVTGENTAIAELLRRCRAEEVRTLRLNVDLAGHSRYLDPLRQELLEQPEGLAPRPTSIAYYSTVDGYPHDTPLDGATLGVEYWYDNLRNPVRFADTTLSLAGQSHVTFLECSPHPVLLPAIGETLDTAGLTIGTLQRTKPPADCLAEAMARLSANGHNLDWRALHPAAAVVDLPTYPFEHRHYWLAPQPSGDVTTAGQRTTHHSLLGAAIDLPDDEGLLLTGCVGLASHPWLADHAATGVVLVPGTAYLDMVLHAARLAGCTHIAELTLHAPMVLSGQDALDLQLRIGPPDEGGHRTLALHARDHAPDSPEPSPWALHATARLTPEPPVHPPAADPAQWPPVEAEPLDLVSLRRLLSEAGYDYGPAFAGLRSAWRHGERLYVEAHLPDGLATTGHTIHPALLDTALHPIALHPLAPADPADEEAHRRAGLRLPFTFEGITLVGNPTRQLRAQLHLTKPDTVSVVATDEAGAPVLTIDALTLRGTTSDHLRRLARVGPAHDLLQLTWRSPLPSTVTDAVDVPDTATWALLGTDPYLSPACGTIPRYAGLSDLAAAIRSGTPPPKVVVWPLPPLDPAEAEDVPGVARTLCDQVLHFLQAWLPDDQLSRTALVVLTRRAVVTGPHESPSLAHGPAWGLLHTAQNEHPTRIVLVDTDHPLDDLAPLTAVLAGGHPQSAIRDGQPRIPYLARATTAEVLTPPPDTPLWRLDVTSTGGLDNLTLLPAPEAAAPLRTGQLRLAVHAAGINFYDTARALGLVPPQHDIGADAAGIVCEIGPGVSRFAVGDRVTALTEGAFGPAVVADHRTTARIPDEWSFAQAASVPVAFITAYHALVDLANLRPGETVLIHSAAGGVGQAAVQLARHLGAEPFATAHPSKWDTLRRLGYPEDHIASSRTLDFAESFRAASGGRGMDVVLNSLAGPFIDTSLDLTAPDGRFLELGKTDIRDARQVATTHPNLSYQHVDLRRSASPDRVGQILADLLHLFRTGVLTPLPVTAYGIRDATQAFRLMQKARHTGKVVLTLPRPLDPAGTILITGGTGTLGGLLARHLVTAHHARHLLLASRSGPDAAGAAQLRADLEDQGATVTIAACDTADPRALRSLLDSLPPDHPLTGVFHTAGVLADATVTNLAPGDFEKVFAPKIDAAWHLHELTKHLDLAAFVLYSSSAGTLGSPGQGNYAAANTFLDALAHHRRRQGLPATSLAWGWWQPVSTLSRGLTDADNTRIARSGLAPITSQHGHALLDAALELPHPVLAASPLNQQTLHNNSRLGTLHPLLSRLATSTTTLRAATSTGPAPDLRKDLAALAPDVRLRQLTTLITTHAAAVLSLDASTQFPPDQSFKAFGFDSLTALELRNRLATATGLRLPASLTYDFPTATALASHLGKELFPSAEGNQTTTAEDSRIHRAIASIPLERLRELGLLDALLQLAAADAGPVSAAPRNGVEDITTANLDELVAIALSTEQASSTEQALSTEQTRG